MLLSYAKRKYTEQLLTFVSKFSLAVSVQRWLNLKHSCPQDYNVIDSKLHLISCTCMRKQLLLLIFWSKSSSDTKGKYAEYPLVGSSAFLSLRPQNNKNQSFSNKFQDSPPSEMHFYPSLHPKNPGAVTVCRTAVASLIRIFNKSSPFHSMRMTFRDKPIRFCHKKTFLMKVIHMHCIMVGKMEDLGSCFPGNVGTFKFGEKSYLILCAKRSLHSQENCDKFDLIHVEIFCFLL